MNNYLRKNFRIFYRIFLVIFLCSFVPIGTLVLLTFFNTNSEITKNAARRLHDDSKNVGMVILSRLNDFELILDQLIISENMHYKNNISNILLENSGLTNRYFESIIYFENIDDGVQKLFLIDEKANTWLLKGRSKISVVKNSEFKGIWILRFKKDASGHHGLIAGAINPEILKNISQIFLPINGQVLLLDSMLNPLLNGEFKPDINLKMLNESDESRHHLGEVEYADSKWIFGSWPIFLRSQFEADRWHVIVLENKQDVFSSLYRFFKDASMTSILTFWIILLLSSLLVRKILSPLDKFKKATEKIGSGNYNFSINIDSQDEFEDLSVSFNKMVEKINLNIKSREQMGSAIRGILSEIDTESIINKLIFSLHELGKFEYCCVVISYNTDSSNLKKWCSKNFENKIHIKHETIDNLIDKYHIENLKSKNYEFINLEIFGNHLSDPKGHENIALNSFQIDFSGNVIGWIICANKSLKIGQEEIAIINQLTDQLQVALSKALVVEEIDNLNVGILTALARSVDANSNWTHGHSERVTQYAIAIAKEMGFNDSDLIDVHRAGLLHDLGKLSVPSHVLDKPGSLNLEEKNIVKKHPAEGARILEPIKGFSKILPAIEQHHERWDGSGYPLGLKGSEIHPLARIISVADVYDALYSDRPYRKGWSHEKVINYLKENSGKIFDPSVIEASFKVIHKPTSKPHILQ